jgi:hypothetical protein
MKVLAIHNSSMTNEEYEQKLYKKYGFLRMEVYDVLTKKLGEADTHSDSKQLYFDTDSIVRNNTSVFTEIQDHSQARVIWISVGSQKAAVANPDGGKRHKTFTGATKVDAIDESFIL